MTGPGRELVIVGGGAIGWMAALALARAVEGGEQRVTLVDLAEPEPEPELGPAVAPPPLFDGFLAAHAIDEDALLAAARGCFSLGRVFSGWSVGGGAWFLPFGDIGAPMGPVAFHHLADRLRRGGASVRLADFSLAGVAAASGRFARPVADRRSVLSSYGYGLHLDTAAFTAQLKARALGKGVRHVAAPYRVAELGADGAIAALVLESGDRIAGDLFIDCSGSRAVLIQGALATGFESWRHWLPCDRVAMRSAADPGVPPPYSHAGAFAAGWRQTIPLRGGPGEALYYASARSSQADLDDFGGDAPRPFESGRAARAWNRNCVAIGAAAVTLEPLHGQELQLAYRALDRLARLLPAAADGPEPAEYDRLATAESEAARDFLILHYKTNGRLGEPLWDDCRAMAVPEGLQRKIDLFASRGMVPMYDDEPFDRPDWIAALDGQGITPRRRDALAETLAEPAIAQHFARLRELIHQAARGLPGHGATLRALGLEP